MGGPVSPWVAKARVLLADGQWRDREWVLRQIMPLVPAGRALRKTEWSRTRVGRAEGQPVGPRKVMRSEDFQIASGRRHLAVQGLGGVGFETKREGGTVWIRRKPKPAEEQQ